MLETLASALSGLKQASPSLLLGCAIGSGLILFSPEPFIATLGLDAFRQANKPYIGGTFVASLALLTSQWFFHCWSFVKGILAKIEARKKLEKEEAARRQRLHELTPDEKAYLLPYVMNDVNTQYFQIEDGVVGGLLAKAILYQASMVGSLIDGWAFNMKPWAKAYLVANPHLLEGANPTPEGPPRW